MNQEILPIVYEVKKELGDYHFPKGFNPHNAAIGASIEFAKNNNFQGCTFDSVKKALLDMFVQGLNPLKGNCYFIRRKNTLQLQRQYNGSILVAKREDKRIKSVNATVVLQKDIFEYSMVNALLSIQRHVPCLDIPSTDNIICAYAVAVDYDDKPLYTDIISWEGIRKNWRKSQSKVDGAPVVDQNLNVNPMSTHGMHPDRMARRTIIQRLCESIIKSSSSGGDDVVMEVPDLSHHSDDFENMTPVRVQEQQPKVLDFPQQTQPPVAEKPPARQQQEASFQDMQNSIGSTNTPVENNVGTAKRPKNPGW